MHLLTTLRGLATFACFSLVVSADSLSNETPKSIFTFDQLWSLEKTFWDSFLYPANVKQTQGNSSTIFASDVSLCCPT